MHFLDTLVYKGNRFNPLTAKLFNLNFHRLEVVDRVSETDQLKIIHI